MDLILYPLWCSCLSLATRSRIAGRLGLCILQNSVKLLVCSVIPFGNVTIYNYSSKCLIF
jgi:hypothetical protein